MNHSFLWKPEKNASEESDVKDSVAVLHKDQNCHLMTSGLLSSQLTQCLSGKLLSCSGIGIYFTQIVCQKKQPEPHLIRDKAFA